MYDGKVDMNTAYKDGAADAIFSAGGTLLAGSGKVAKEAAVTYSRYARNGGKLGVDTCRGKSWEVLARALAVSSDLATGVGSFYGNGK